MSCEQREGLQSDERYLFTEVLGAYPKITIHYHTSSVGSVYEGMDAWGIPPNWREPVFRLHQRCRPPRRPQASDIFICGFLRACLCVAWVPLLPPYFGTVLGRVSVLFSVSADCFGYRLILHVAVVETPVCTPPILYTPCPCAVPIIRLLGTTFPHLRLDSLWKWYHIMKKTSCYRNHF
jgi:hypothetical protein